jgi:3-oxoacyl-[acyl-carrier protein] reductase
MTAGRTLPASLDLTGRRAIVTGASRGIGRAIAQTLAARGATVVVNYRSGEAAAREVCDAIASAGGIAHAIGFDVADPTAAEAGMKAAIEQLGGLEILVNNAGISIDALIMRAATADFDATIATNLRGAFVCSKVAARHLLKAKERGRIVNLSSVVGEQGNPGQSMYAASKAGVIGLTKSLARELAGRGITVNAITPGYIETDMTAAAVQGDARTQLLSRIPLGRVGQAQDIAEAVAFLASDAAAYVTGHVMRVNGGLAI